MHIRSSCLVDYWDGLHGNLLNDGTSSLVTIVTKSIIVVFQMDSNVICYRHNDIFKH